MTEDTSDCVTPKNALLGLFNCFLPLVGTTFSLIDAHLALRALKKIRSDLDKNPVPPIRDSKVSKSPEIPEIPGIPSCRSGIGIEVAQALDALTTDIPKVERECKLHLKALGVLTAYSAPLGILMYYFPEIRNFRGFSDFVIDHTTGTFLADKYHIEKLDSIVFTSIVLFIVTAWFMKFATSLIDDKLEQRSQTKFNQQVEYSKHTCSQKTNQKEKRKFTSHVRYGMFGTVDSEQSEEDLLESNKQRKGRSSELPSSTTVAKIPATSSFINDTMNLIDTDTDKDSSSASAYQS